MNRRFVENVKLQKKSEKNIPMYDKLTDENLVNNCIDQKSIR